jgi:hypothetical protein
VKPLVCFLSCLAVRAIKNITMAVESRDDHIYMAKLSEQAERYDDMVSRKLFISKL